MKPDPAMLCLAALLGASAPGAAFASVPFQDLAEIDAAIVAATGQKIGQVGGAIGPVDRRLKLARCPATVQVDPPNLGAIAVRCAAIGWRLRVTLVAGVQTAAPAQVALKAPEILVKRGDTVQLVVAGQGFEVSGSAVAMEDGALGKGIRVKSPTSKTPVSANVVGPSAVKISL